MRYTFGECELDISAHALRRAGAEVHVEPQVFDLIACLLRAGGELVTYDGLIAEVWDGRIVSDATLAARISAARAAVGDDGKRQAVIRTVPRRGVQLAVPVSEAGAAPQKPLCEAARRQVIRYATSQDGTGIAWAETGEGPPLLRAGHWMSHLEHDWTSPVWRPLLDRLATGRRLVRYDPRGTGLSDRDVDLDAAGVAELADDLEAVADAAGLDRFPVYATSQSVPVALTFAARRPERVSRLFLMNGFAAGSEVRGDPGEVETMVGLIRSGWGQPGSAFMKAIATLFMPRSTPEEVEAMVEMQALSASPEVAAAIRRLIGRIDVREVLDRVTCPVLVAHASGDAIQPPEQSKLLARRLSGASFLQVDSPNHVVPPGDAAWEVCLDAFERFVGE